MTSHQAFKYMYRLAKCSKLSLHIYVIIWKKTELSFLFCFQRKFNCKIIFWVWVFNSQLCTLSNRFTWETTLYLRNLRSYWTISDPVNFAEKIEKTLLQIGLSHQDKFAMQFWFNQLCHKNCVIEKTTIYIVKSNYYIEKSWHNIIF